MSVTLILLCPYSGPSLCVPTSVPNSHISATPSHLGERTRTMGCRVKHNNTHTHPYKQTHICRDTHTWTESVWQTHTSPHSEIHTTQTSGTRNVFVWSPSGASILQTCCKINASSAAIKNNTSHYMISAAQCGVDLVLGRWRETPREQPTFPSPHLPIRIKAPC